MDASVLQALTDQVAATKGAEASAIVLIKALADKIAAAAGDNAAVLALTSELKTSADDLGAAVVANPA